MDGLRRVEPVRPPVLNKQDFYRRSRLGEFGNTCPEWFSVDDWAAGVREKNWHSKQWGIRHTRIAGFAGTRLNVPTADVADHVRNVFQNGDYQISPMVNGFANVVFEGDVTDRYISGNFNPPGGSWRKHMLKPRLIEGSAAKAVLRTYLNENSQDDLAILLEQYPDHVIELTILDACFGTVPHRNAVIWEVRRY